MVGEVAAGMTALKSAFDLAKGIAEIGDAARRNAQAIELQRQILTAQESALAANSAQTALLENIRSLKEEVARLEAWDAEKEKYKLEQVYSGAFARVLKEDAGGSEPPHWLCTNCFEHNRKSILQEKGRDQDPSYKLFGCPACKAVIRVFYQYGPGVPWNSTPST
jgi:hypothetical protein